MIQVNNFVLRDHQLPSEVWRLMMVLIQGWEFGDDASKERIITWANDQWANADLVINLKPEETDG